jgi:hypothetical protein
MQVVRNVGEFLRDNTASRVIVFMLAVRSVPTPFLHVVQCAVEYSADCPSGADCTLTVRLVLTAR